MSLFSSFLKLRIIIIWIIITWYYTYWLIANISLKYYPHDINLG